MLLLFVGLTLRVCGSMSSGTGVALLAVPALSLLDVLWTTQLPLIATLYRCSNMVYLNFRLSVGVLG